MADKPLHVSELTHHIHHSDADIFHLNMIKLNDMLPAMMLTVDERLMLEELVTTYFNRKPAPQLPWVKKSHEAQARQTLRRKTKSEKTLKEEKKQ